MGVKRQETVENSVRSTSDGCYAPLHIGFRGHLVDAKLLELEPPET